MSNPFSRSQFPQHGWTFFQPQTGWNAPMPMVHSFDRTVQEIIRHRQQNGAITARHHLSLDPTTVGNELENYTRMRLGIAPLEVVVPKPSPQQPLPQVVVGAVEGLKRTAYGVAPIMEWLGSGGQAVPTELSTKRAEICSICPKNGSPNLGQWFTVKASELIQRELQKRNDLNLSTPFDDKLGVCSACLCPLKLKVHTPMDVIQRHMKPEIRADLDARCWILAGT